MVDAANPLLAPSPLPFSLPPYAQIIPQHYAEAFDLGMREQRAEVERIITDPEPASFENTLVALERSGALLTRVTLAFYGVRSAHATPEIEALNETYTPLLTAHSDAIRLDGRLFDRLRAVADSPATAGLDDESRRLVERYLTELGVAGAGLGTPEKARLRELNEQLAALGTRFEKFLLAEANDLAVAVDDVSRLDGLTTGERSA